MGKLEEERPNLLLLDIMSRSGRAAAARENEGRDRFRTCPFLMISSMPPEEATVKALGLGAADFISKPFRCASSCARQSPHPLGAGVGAGPRRRGAEPGRDRRYPDEVTDSHQTRRDLSHPGAARGSRAPDLRSARWCSPSRRPAGRGSCGVRKPDAAQPRSSSPAIPRSSGLDHESLGAGRRRERGSAGTTKSACAGSASRSPCPPAPRSRCRFR